MTNLQITITTNGKKVSANISVPEKWDEVLPETFPHLARIYLMTANQMSEADKTVRAMVLLTAAHYPVISKLSDEEMYSILPLVDWVFNKLDLVKNLIPEIKINETVLIGPANRMDNIRFAEWCVADTFFVQYCQTKNPADLNKLIATIYRPAGNGPEFTLGDAIFRGDKRQKFNDQLLEDRTLLVAQLDQPIKDGIFVWFASCRAQIIQDYTEFFPPEPVEGQPDVAENKKPTDFDQWMGIYDDLRGDPRFGGADKLEDEFLHTVLHSQERAIRKMKKLKEKYDV